MATLAGRYTLLHALGRGGFATVYEAQDTATGDHVAVKILLPHLAADDRVRARFLAEAQILATAHHPGIMRLHAVGEDGDQPYLVMELVQGRSLGDLISDDPYGLPFAEVQRIITALASALDYIHAAGIVHRDLKPSNVMVTAAGRVVLMDFGIARLMDQARVTFTGAFIGTPEYVAPEQVEGQAVGPAADIYALGTLAFHLLSGHPPFTGEMAAVLYAHAHVPPPDLHLVRPDLPPQAAEAIAAALAKRPDDRPPTAASFAGRLAAPAAARRAIPATAPASPPAPPPPVAGTPARPLRTWALAGVIAVAVVALATLAVLLTRNAPNSAAGRPPDSPRIAAVSTLAGGAATPVVTASPAAVATAVVTPSSTAAATRAPVTPTPGPPQIAYIGADNRLMLTDAAAARPRELMAGPVAEFAWSPDGRQILAAVWRRPAAGPPRRPEDVSGELRLLDVETGNQTVLVGAKAHGLSWFPDGRSVAFVRNTIGRDNYTAYSVDVLTIANRQSRTLQPPVPEDVPGSGFLGYTWYISTAPAPTADALYVAGKLAMGIRNVFLKRYELAGQKVDTVAGHAGTFAISRNGAIASYYNDTTFADLTVTGRDGATLFEETNPLSGVIGAPAWAPDGSQIATAGSDGIFLITMAPGSPQQRLVSNSRIISTLSISRGAWSPDGAYLCYGQSSGGVGGANDVFVVPTRGGTPVALGAGTAPAFLPRP